MIRLSKALRAWHTPDFNTVLKAEIEHIDADLLPLQEGLSQSSHAIADRLSAIILAVAEEPDRLRVKAGLLYAGIIAGCSCADDPTPVEPQNEYCELRFEIDMATGAATVSPVRD